MAKFEKNNKGKSVGTLNKATKTVKEAFTDAFGQMQLIKGVNLVDWAKENPTEFYKLCTKLIPVAINADLTTLGKEIKQVFKIGNTEIEL